jgi:glucan phosphoethanolaminetransferase (alkaline phosphatase superfamily)
MKLTEIFAFFKEDSPYSTMRIAMIFILVAFVPWFTYVWTVVSLGAHILAEIPVGVQWLLAVLLGAKFVQKGIELIPKAIETYKGMTSSTTETTINKTTLTTDDKTTDQSKDINAQ